MGCLGVHFALTKEEVDKLRARENDSERLGYFQEEVEDAYFSDHEDLMAQSDKAWDAMHRCLSNGDLTYETGSEPLRFVVMGGEPLYFKDDYIMSLKTPDQVRAVAQALPAITQEELFRRYDAMDAKKYGCPKSDEDRAYTWEWFQEVAALFQKAAADGRFVLFTASQ
jgi:hypothetical protein